jgi:hypothetical protein
MTCTGMLKYNILELLFILSFGEDLAPLRKGLPSLLKTLFEHCNEFSFVIQEMQRLSFCSLLFTVNLNSKEICKATGVLTQQKCFSNYSTCVGNRDLISFSYR